MHYVILAEATTSRN